VPGVNRTRIRRLASIVDVAAGVRPWDDVDGGERIAAPRRDKHREHKAAH
jgi:hypothetical protein